MDQPYQPPHGDQGATPSRVPSLSGADEQRARVQRVTSEALLGIRKELEILHGPHLYRLRVTSTGKLILTK